jgi:hypothetical protein
MKRPLLAFLVKSKETRSMKLRYAVLTALFLILPGSQALSVFPCDDACVEAKRISGAYTCISSCSGKARIVYQPSFNTVTCVNETNQRSDGAVRYGIDVWTINCFGLTGKIVDSDRSIDWSNGHIWVREGCKCQKYKYKP